MDISPFVFLNYVCACIRVRMGTCYGIHVKFRGQLCGVTLALHPHVSFLGGVKPTVRLVRQVPLPSNRLAGPSSVVQVLFCGSGWCSVCYTAQVTLQLKAILQPQLPECWNDRHGPPQLGSMLFFRKLLAEA